MSRRVFSSVACAAVATAIALPLRVPVAASAAVTNFTISLDMRDGIGINSVVYLPSLAAGQKVGTILMRTPYSVTSLADTARAYATIGWAVVTSDERGKFASGGVYTMWRSAANDTYDTITTFIRLQSWSNGLVAWTGGSANAIMGYVTPLASPGPPPGMASQFNIVGSARLHEFMFQGGAYREELITGWLTANGEVPMIDVVKAHEGWGPFYTYTTQSNDRWALTDWPVLHLAGWYDIFSTIQIADALAFDAAGGPKARGNQILVIEAGGHCAGGAIAWPNATWGAALANDFSLTLFADTIGAPAAATPEAAAVLAHARVSVGALRARLGAGSSIIWYILGSGAAGDIGNLWAGGTVATFTNTTTHRFYLHAGGALTPAPPTTAEAPTGWGADPDRAIPTVGGNVLTIAPCGPQDQRLVEDEYAPEMARFVSAPLASLLVVNGVITAQLWVTSTAVDIDVAVKVTDVFPTGESMLVQDGIVRMRWRNGPFANVTAPPLLPGAPYAVNVTVGHMSYAFSPGHRVAVAVSSYNFPRFSANPNNGEPMSDPAGPHIVARNTVLTDAAHPSVLLLPALPIGALDAVRL